MRNNIADFTTEEKYLIVKLYSMGTNIHEIAYRLQLSFQEVLFVLNRMIDDLNYREILPYANLDDPKILIISDTHIGSIYENFDYLKEVYKLAKEQGIHTILHGGDLIQSTYTNVSNKYRDEYRQLEHVVEDYPLDESITNYILFGNHDYNTLKKARAYLEILKTRKDFELLGFKRAYINWNGIIVSLFHTTKKYHLSVPRMDTDLNLKGHSHKLSHGKDKRITIPTLSDDLLQHKDAIPGFLLGTQTNSHIALNSYIFKNDSLQEEGRILTKKLK